MARTELAAFQGERGAFSEEAARRLLGAEVRVNPCPSFQEVFRSLVEKRVTAAVIPIENTLHGSVHENYDHLLDNDLIITGETFVRIVHNLIAAPGVSFAKVREVYSHPVALNQCLKFFAEHPRVEKKPFYDTAGSVKMVMAEGLRDAAGIASASCAEIYGAKILKRSIEDDRQNYTRFFLLRRPDQVSKQIRNKAPDASVNWKTSLVFNTKNEPGSLFRCMSAFALRDLSLAKIESRPLKGKPWEYLFYLDFYGHPEQDRAHNALRHLAEVADYRVLGSYAAAS